MQLQQVTRKQQKMRLALQGDTHSGKTLSALLIAYGLIGDWRKIVVIDTEQNSASFYSHLGPFNTIQLSAPFNTAKFIDAIDLCENARMEVIILDTISSEWVGEGGVLDIYAATTGDKAVKYDAVIPNHHAFISYIQESSVHIIATVYSAGAKVQQQRGYAQYFTTALRMNQDHQASVIKDKTGLFSGICPTRLSESIGARLQHWCDAGERKVPQELQRRIDACTSQQQLVKLLVDSDLEDASLVNAFTMRRLELDTD
jgi:RecG-like helicase